MDIKQLQKVQTGLSKSAFRLVASGGLRRLRFARADRLQLPTGAKAGWQRKADQERKEQRFGF